MLWKKFEWQETIVINGPGQRPEDNIEADALTLENMRGETHTYHWSPKADQSFDYTKGPSHLDLPAEANIQIVNLKAEQRPFEIVPPEGSHLHTYNSEKSYSMFEWWNHWPVAQIPSSGRPAIAADRASHSSLSDISWGDYEKTGESETKLLMTGMVSLTPEQLLPLAKSWLSTPSIHAAGAGALGAVYDPAERAFVVHRAPEAAAAPLVLTIEASSDSPLVNPALVIENWRGNAKVQLNGRPLKTPGSARMGHSHRLAHDNLILWMPLTAKEKTQIRVEAARE